MLWPLVVAACECCHDVPLQATVMDLLGEMEDQFFMSHLLRVRTLFASLLRSVSSDNADLAIHCLGGIARHLELVVPLFGRKADCITRLSPRPARLQAG